MATSGKKEKFSPKEVSAQILEELSKAIGTKDKSPAVSAINQREPFVSKSEMKKIVRDEFRWELLVLELIILINAINSLFSQGVCVLVLETLFVIIVERKDTLIITVVRGLTLEFLVVLVIGRVVFSLKVKEVLVGNLISRETKTRPCLVAK